MKPILFNTDMVRAILDGRKSVTRRVVKPPYYIDDEEASRVSGLAIHQGTRVTDGMPYPDAPYRPGSVLYVRERWRVQSAKRFDAEVRIEHMAGGPMITIKFPRREDFDAFVYKWADNKWHPSIHMPKEAARLFLRVTGVRVERLQDITEEQAYAEGIETLSRSARYNFGILWDSTIKKADLPRYGWAASPWVWVIEFERISKEEAAK